MGYGDEIMATGEARRLQERDPRPVLVVGETGAPRWHPLWAGNPRLLRARGGAFQELRNGPRCRPYIDAAAMRRDLAAVFPGRAFTTKVRDARLPWRYTDWRATPGELFLPRLEPRGYVLVEPCVKTNSSPNKDWGWERWQALVRLLDLPWVQAGPPGRRILDGVRHIATPTFEAACTALSGASAAVLPEGGLHHAAAALGVPGVVIFGGYASPANTGYEMHVNLYEPQGGPCGQRVPCGHCRRAMAAITPDIVAFHLEELLQ